MTTIIALAGRKQAGKTTLSNYLHGNEMKKHGVIDKFFISPEGKLVVNCTFTDLDSGKDFEDMGVLDLYQQTEEFYRYAENRIWPLVKSYNFADSLKELCVGLFNIPYECVHGTDEQKNQLQEHLRWEKMPGVISDSRFNSFLLDHKIDLQAKNIVYHEPGPMTAREFMQFFGTEICRRIYSNIWIDNCIKRIMSDGSPIAVIGDCRFLNEAEAIKKAGGKVIRLTRSIYESNHQSEVDLDNYTNFDAVIDNQNMSIDQSCEEFMKILTNMGITTKARTFGKYTVSVK